MNILYIILHKTNEKVSKETINSIKSNLKEEETILNIGFDDYEEKQQYYTLENKIKNNDFSHVCIIPNGSFLETNMRELINEYIDSIDNSNKIFLPFSLLITNKEINGLLNTSLWSQYAVEVGKLDHELSLMQSDTNLFGAIIPKELFFNKDSYNNNLRFYQHYYMLNKWSENDNIEIIGIPKIVINLNYDLSFSNESKEIKIENFLKARESWENKLEVVK